MDARWKLFAGLMLAYLIGCGTTSATLGSPANPEWADESSWIVDMETGECEAPTLLPSRGFAPIQVSQAEFQAAMAKLATDLRLPRKANRPTRLIPISWRPEVEATLSSDYEGWCQQLGRPRDCLELK